MFANYHTHTWRCHHASGTEKEYVETAIKGGLKILGFSDHTPYPFPEGVDTHAKMGMDELEGYVDTVLGLREEYKDDIEIHLGLEVEYLPPYFDELDSLALVVTTRDERVEFSKPLVRHTERWPGGKKFVTDEKQSVGTLHSGSRNLLLYLAEGQPREDLKLKEWKVDFDIATKEDAEIMCQVEITPGQGLATACFFASFLERPKLIDIGSATPSDMTKVRIERELKRHFPPTMPYVEACEEMWVTIKSQINDFLINGSIIILQGVDLC